MKLKKANEIWKVSIRASDDVVIVSEDVAIDDVVGNFCGLPSHARLVGATTFKLRKVTSHGYPL